jgi:hypothetical protein
MEPNLEPARQLVKSTQLLTEIMTGLRHRYASLNGIHYEAGWTDSWCHRRCMHVHRTLIDAARCGMRQVAGWYVIAVDSGSPRELTTDEDEVVNRFRFSGAK